MSRNIKVDRLFGHYPTMVANGRGGLPRARYSSRLRMNPSDMDDALADAFGGKVRKVSAKEASSSTVRTKVRAPKDKLRADKVRSITRKTKTPARSVSRKTKDISDAKHSAIEARIRAEVMAELAGKTSQRGAVSESKRRSTAIALQRANKLAEKHAKEAKRARKYFIPFRVDYVDGELTRTDLTRNGRPRGSKNKTHLKVENVSAPKHAGRPAGSKNAPHRSGLVGPYKFTLLKNPVVDFEIGGIKVLPAVVGIAGASLLTKVVAVVPQYKDMQPSWYKDMIPGGVAVAVAALAYSYAKKEDSKLAMEVCSNVAAFGMFCAGSTFFGNQVDKLVSSVITTKAPAENPPTTAPLAAPVTPAVKGIAGGQFFEIPSLKGGGYFRPDDIPKEQMNGYVINGERSGFPPAFMTGNVDYSTSLSDSNANSAEALRALSLAGGQSIKLGSARTTSTGFGMSDFAD